MDYIKQVEKARAQLPKQTDELFKQQFPEEFAFAQRWNEIRERILNCGFERHKQVIISEDKPHLMEITMYLDSRLRNNEDAEKTIKEHLANEIFRKFGKKRHGFKLYRIINYYPKKDRYAVLLLDLGDAD